MVCLELRLLTQHIFHNFAVDIRQSVVATLEAVGQPFVVNSQLVQDGGLKIVYVDGVLRNVHAVVVGFAVAHPSADAAAR